MNKTYDYWLIIWKRGDAEIHEPMCFQVGVDPKEWCEITLDRSNNTRDERAARYTSYSVHKLEVVNG